MARWQLKENNRWCAWVKCNPAKATLLMLLFGLTLGIIFWGGFNTAIEWTNRTEFCISCHEMTIPYEEYKESAHYSNTAGLAVSCSDCHVASSKTPNDYARKLLRKLLAARDVFGHLRGTIDTPEKYEEKRLEMAKRVWESMRASDSAECRNCHNLERMDPEQRSRIARNRHARAVEEGTTCIECHRGVSHHEPVIPLEELGQY